MFDPLVNTLRIHWISPRGTDELLFSNSLSAFGREFIGEDRYYRKDHSEHPDFEFIRLGRRAFKPRRVGNKILQPHKFWGIYLTEVASENFRGNWYGLAPLRVKFKKQTEEESIRVRPEVFQNLPTADSVSQISAFPTSYVLPIGWAAGIVAEIRGRFPLRDAPRLLKCLSHEPAFLQNGTTRTLQEILLMLHRLIHTTLLSGSQMLVRESVNPYIICSPIQFEGQSGFQGLEDADLSLLVSIINGNADVPANKYLRTANEYGASVTVFNRGTCLVVRASGDEPHKAGACALANYKNALLMTTLMYRFMKFTTGASRPVVKQMRSQVMETFRTLLAKYDASHLQAVWENHEGFKRMQLNGGSVSNYNFYGPVSESPIGDHATLIQNMDVKQLARELDLLHSDLQSKATTPEQESDVQKVKEAAEEAKKGDKEAAFKHLKQIGEWGLQTLKELTSSIVAESLVKLLGG